MSSAPAATVHDDALHVAIEQADFELCEQLIAAGANLDARDKNNNTPLALSIAFWHHDLMAQMLRRGANPNARVGPADSPELMRAVYTGSTRAVLALLEAGADAGACNSQGLTILGMAHQEADSGERARIVEILEDVERQRLLEQVAATTPAQPRIGRRL